MNVKILLMNIEIEIQVKVDTFIFNGFSGILFLLTLQ